MATSPIPTPNPLYFTPDLKEFISRQMRAISADINACLIGSITAINSNGTITAAVSYQKIIRGVVPIPNSNIMGDQIINYPALVNVPVFTYQGGGAYISMPIAIGDPCLLLFCDRDMDIWMETGQVAPPNSDRIHNINDAIAIVGINNLQNLLPINTSGIIKAVDHTGERLMQSGMMVPYAGAATPSGWLLCAGQAISRTAYPNLFAAIGVIWGIGDGSTTFNLPNLGGYVPGGYLAGDPNFGTLGAVIGEATHTLDIAEIPAHTHTYYNPNTANSTSGNQESDGGRFPFVDNTGSTGGGGAHNNIQPTIVVNWLIKI